MMPNGIRRHVALTMLAVGGLLFASCSSAGGRNPSATPAPGDKDYGKALLFVDTHFLGSKKAYAYPDTIVITGYDKTPNQIVTWSYIHKKAKIKFDEPKIGENVDCKDGTGVCTLTLPTGLMEGLPQSQLSRKLKYTLKGEDSQGPLHDNDPWVEVVR